MKKLFALGCLGLLSLLPASAADAAKGKDTFDNNCAVCHNADSTDVKIGPGLKGLYKKAALNNKKKPSDAAITTIINEGGNGMPPFGDQLTPAEKLDLIAYLKTL
jgi:mono/diheme cytochrome c family protein